MSASKKRARGATPALGLLGAFGLLTLTSCNLHYRDEQVASFDACWVRAPASRLAFREDGLAAYSDAGGLRLLDGRLDVYGSLSFFPREGEGEPLFKFCRLIDMGDALQCETDDAALGSPVRFEFARRGSILFEATDACGAVFGPTVTTTVTASVTTGSGGGGAGGDGGGGAECRGLAESCSGADECCSGRCALGVCSAL